jgi:hypothetical protein
MNPIAMNKTQSLVSKSIPLLEPNITSTTKQETTSSSPVVCSKYYHFDASLKKCIPDLEPDITSTTKQETTSPSP